jgi:CRP-like cAMP-binding protein
VRAPGPAEKFPSGSDKYGNRLLATLDRTDLELLAPHLYNETLARGLVLQEQEAAVEKVYFPVSGVVSLISVMEGGEVVEPPWSDARAQMARSVDWDLGMRSRERSCSYRALRPSSRWRACKLRSAIDRIRNLILRYKEALLAQVQQTAACNALHEVDKRLARWLLQALDRTESLNLPLTQDFISQMLAVRRSTVTVIAGKRCWRRRPYWRGRSVWLSTSGRAIPQRGIRLPTQAEISGATPS